MIIVVNWSVKSPDWQQWQTVPYFMMFVDQKYPHDNSANERLNDYVCKPWYHDEYECLLIFCSPNMGGYKCMMIRDTSLLTEIMCWKLSVKLF